jgi:xanthine dehydrogenase accessory factor
MKVGSVRWRASVPKRPPRRGVRPPVYSSTIVLDLLNTLLTRLAAGEPVALCVLVRARGSTPQATGAMMLVLSNGETLGTLGGGCVEAEMRTRALRAIADGQFSTRLNSFKLDHDFGWDDGLMCGGSMDVAVWPMRSMKDAEPLIAVRDALAAKQATSLAISIEDEAGERLSFALPFTPRQTLLIAGAGHVGQAIATMAASIDFDVVVMDDREDFMTAARFPQARRVAGPIDRELGRWPIDAHTFVVIVTRGHKNDAAALGSVVNSPAAYVGMIGSKRKVRTILEGLEKAGVARERLLKVHAPIGLEIGAITPGEIAVSVCAELIAVRRGIGGRAAESLKIGSEELVRWLDRDSLSS